MCIHVLDFEALIKLLAKDSANKLKDFKENILFAFKNTHLWMTPRFVLQINGGKISLTSNPKSHSILIEADRDVLTSILIGALKPSKALMTRKLKIRPLLKIHRSLRLLSLLQLHDSWFHPRADFG